MAVVIPIRDLPQYMRRLGSAFGPALLAGLTSAASRSVAELVRATDNKGVVNLGRYKAGWTFSPAFQTGPASARVRVFNDAPYSGVIELGRRAGSRLPWVGGKPVDQQPIYLWCKSKLGMSDEEATKAAWPIAVGIKRKGIKGRRVMADILGRLKELGAKEVNKSLERAIRRLSPGGP